MSHYVDGFVIPLRRDRVEEYRRVAGKASQVWMDHGALSYRECVGEDMASKDAVAFPQLAGAKEDETVVFAWIVFRSRAHRDEVNAKVMADERLQEIMAEGACPFDPARMTSREWEVADLIWVHRPPGRDAEIADHARRCGVPPDLIATFQNTRHANQERSTLDGMLPFPARREVISPGESLAMGGREWTAIHAPGHSDAQLVFHSPADGLLLAGDQVLPHITPNIGLWPGIEPDPLGRYLASLRELENLPVALALPGHGEPITNFAGRVRALLAHHTERLMHMEGVVRAKGRATAMEVALASFDFAGMSQAGWGLALVETLSHLEYAERQGRLRREEDAAGAWQFLVV